MDDSRLEHDRRVEQAKLDAMKELAYGASHEINNPLANISARAQALMRDEADLERRRALQAIHEQALRAHEMISDLMLYARPPELHTSEFDLSALLQRLVNQNADVCTERSVGMQVEADQPIPRLCGDGQLLQVALSAVIRNAIEAIGRNGTIAIRVSSCQGGDPSAAPPGSSVCIQVIDDGSGFSDSALRHALDPFYSGREAGRGLGFGLSKCWRIVTQHGGAVHLENLTAGGACVTIWLPKQPPREPIDPASGTPVAASGSGNPSD